MRLIIFCFCLTFVFGNQSIDIAIQKNQAQIQQKIKEQNQINEKIKRLGMQISSQNNELKIVNDEMRILEREIRDNQERFLEEEKVFQITKKKSDELHQRDKNIQAQITKLIAQDLAFRVVVSDKLPASSDDIILNELFGALSKNVKLNIASLTEEKRKISVELEDLTKRLDSLQVVIKKQNQRRAKLQKSIERSNTLIAKLEEDLKNYDAKMSKVAKERRELDLILEKLNIRKQDEKKVKPEESNTQIAEKKRDAPLEVRRMGSSYRQVSTTAYRGAKTIAPIDHYSIDQRFGTYFDPVYKIKVFNESVILTPKKPSANVKNVLDGKVVFAKETPVLKKVVIIEHANQMHTIYAYLDKIAPTIRPGLKIKKGYIVGKVSERLGFEVTQKDKHINPLELIE